MEEGRQREEQEARRHEVGEIEVRRGLEARGEDEDPEPFGGPAHTSFASLCITFFPDNGEEWGMAA